MKEAHPTSDEAAAALIKGPTQEVGEERKSTA